MLLAAMMSGMVASPVWQMCRKGRTSVPRFGQDVARKGLERGAAGAARVDDRRDARVHAREVRVDAVARDAVEDVRVQVDQSGCDDAAADVEDPPGRLTGDTRSDLGDAAALDGYVELGV